MGNPLNSVLRLRDVCAKVGVGKASVYRFMALNEFPKPIRLGSRSVGWLEIEINEWIVTRAAQRQYDSGKALVKTR